MQGKRDGWKSKEQKLRKVKRGWPAERAKEIDRHSGGMQKGLPWEFQSTLVN